VRSPARHAEPTNGHCDNKKRQGLNGERDRRASALQHLMDGPRSWGGKHGVDLPGPKTCRAVSSGIFWRVVDGQRSRWSADRSVALLEPTRPMAPGFKAGHRLGRVVVLGRLQTRPRGTA